MPRVTITLPEISFQAIEKIANEKSESISTIVRNFVDLGLEAHKLSKRNNSKHQYTAIEEYCYKSVIETMVVAKELAVASANFDQAKLDEIREQVAQKFEQLILKS